jgi:hypothetical protein
VRRHSSPWLSSRRTSTEPDRVDPSRRDPTRTVPDRDRPGLCPLRPVRPLLGGRFSTRFDWSPHPPVRWVAGRWGSPVVVVTSRLGDASRVASRSAARTHPYHSRCFRLRAIPSRTAPHRPSPSRPPPDRDRRCSPTRTPLPEHTRWVAESGPTGTATNRRPATVSSLLQTSKASGSGLAPEILHPTTLAIADAAGSRPRRPAPGDGLTGSRQPRALGCLTPGARSPIGGPLAERGHR